MTHAAPAADDNNQITIPASFVAVYSDARMRLRESMALVRSRHELCEDLACHLVEQAQRLYQEARSEEGVLAGIHAGLAQPASGMTSGEARWVTLRLAELLAWHSPKLPDTGEKNQ